MKRLVQAGDDVEGILAEYRRQGLTARYSAGHELVFLGKVLPPAIFVEDSAELSPPDGPTVRTRRWLVYRHPRAAHTAYGEHRETGVRIYSGTMSGHDEQGLKQRDEEFARWLEKWTTELLTGQGIPRDK